MKFARMRYSSGIHANAKMMDSAANMQPVDCPWLIQKPWNGDEKQGWNLYCCLS